MTAGEIGGELLLRVRRIVSRAFRSSPSRPDQAFVSDTELRRALAVRSLAMAARDLRERVEPSLTSGLALKSTAEAFNLVFPRSTDQIRREADLIVQHRIKLFDRVHSFGRSLDWHRDPITEARWPLDHFSRLKLTPGLGSDVRMVWELNRLHHLTTLGRAYVLTADERYAEEVIAQLQSWYQANPPEFGPNWTVAMEAAIRAINIIAASDLLRFSPLVTDEVAALILKLLLAHGRFIRANLESSYRSPSNHYLSNLIGLYAIGAWAHQLAEARAWRDFSRKRLVNEMDRQVLADGVDYEGAIGYHRFVTEVFALFFSLSRATGFDVGERFRERLRAMFDFVRHYLKPDGTAPIIGDSDDGRLLRFRDRSASDHSYLMSIAAVLFEDGVYKQAPQIDEEAIWWFGQEGVKAFERLLIHDGPGSRAFQTAQIFVMRSGELYSIVDCGDHGLRGRGSHAHSDALSFELYAYGRTFLRDPGTYVYSASEHDRNLFRSTPYHNTVRVDGVEISETRGGELFALGANVLPVVNRWESTNQLDELDAEHHAYRRLADPVTHRRIFIFDKLNHSWTVRDIFTGRGLHRFEFFFNFDVGIEVKLEAGGQVTAYSESATLTIRPDPFAALEARIDARWVSPAYGTRVNSSAIMYTLSAEVPVDVHFCLRVSRR